ncbi:hypothetical protein OROMI_002790 [Orobanche minor]
MFSLSVALVFCFVIFSWWFSLSVPLVFCLVIFS